MEGYTKERESTQERLEREAFDWVRRFSSGAASLSDLETLKQWATQSPAHRDTFFRIGRTWGIIGELNLRQPSARLTETRNRDSETCRSTVTRRAFFAGALAASAAGATVLAARSPFGLWTSWSEMAADYRTDVGEQRQITISDAVSVNLNTRTSIALPSSSQATDSLELLSGEAVVSTLQRTGQSPERAFSLKAADGHIIANAARFNVQRTDRFVCVTCLEGTVKVERWETSLFLPSNHQVAYSEKGFSLISVIDPAVVTAWQQGVVVFRSAPLSDVVAEINRYRRGRVILTDEALGRKRFNARFRIEEMNLALLQIEKLFGVRATYLPGGVVLLG